MVKILVDYFADQAAFLKNFEQVRGSQTDFDTVVINNIPTLQTASNLINNLGFEQEIIAFRKVQAIVLRINEKIDESFNQQLKKFRIKYKNGILVAFQSTLSGEESKTYWQLTDDEKYFSIYVNDDHDNAAVMYLHNFILGQMNVHRNGIISTSSQTTTNLDLNDIGDENGNNLLYLAVKDNNLEAVVSFLSKGLDPEGNESSPAIDAAWAKFKSIKDDQKEKSKIEKIMKLLLNANSRFPTSKNWYEDEIVPQAVKDFLEKRENLQRLVDHPDFNKLSEDMSKDDNLIFYYNRHNESFLVYGLRTNNYKILSLMKEGLSIGSHEEVDQVYYEAESVRSSEVCKKKYRKFH
ncbi:unnamed protein product [Chironomus riparius]|uniref:Uncharacterized protein n=1 Tax=Chironomus riparius TaxID=315576 RepID=A0A9N9S6P0_9DIPT|nr:unnamed protein product [Chironomus riparius]